VEESGRRVGALTVETVVLAITEQGWSLQRLARTLEDSSLRLYFAREKLLEIAQGRARAYACVIPQVEDGLFEDWPGELVPKGRYSVFSLDYRDPSLVESVVRILANAVNLTVDTNFGCVAAGDTFISRIDADSPPWEWWRWPDDVEA
jgi:hypothetical protein